MWYVLKDDVKHPSLEIIGNANNASDASEIMLIDVQKYITIPKQEIENVKNDIDYYYTCNNGKTVCLSKWSAYIEDVCAWDLYEY